MRFLTLSIIALWSFAGGLSGQPGGGSVNLESVDCFFGVAERLKVGDTVTPQQWNELLDSPGYAILGGHFGRDMVKQCIELAYDNKFVNKREEIMADTLDEGAMFTAFIVGNLIGMDGNWQQLKDYRRDFDFRSLKEKSIGHLKTFLVDPVDSLVVFSSVNIVCFDKNGRKLDGGITLDLNLAYSKTEVQLVRFLAHEMFHEYLGSVYDEELDARSPALYGLGILQNEGIADLVDKTRPGETVEDPDLPQSIVDLYMETFHNTPQILEYFDTLTAAYLDGVIEASELYRSMSDIIPFDGHANGHYMTLLIQRQGLLPRLLERVEDPIHFARVYNQAAAAQGLYTFSDRFMQHIEDAAGRTGE
ncbi:MAG: hypothetical protein LUE10_05275 [Alistipes sp.]|nr:hypothetical protein [Alistipes sp.]